MRQGKKKDFLGEISLCKDPNSLMSSTVVFGMKSIPLSIVALGSGERV